MHASITTDFTLRNYLRLVEEDRKRRNFSFHFKGKVLKGTTEMFHLLQEIFRYLVRTFRRGLNRKVLILISIWIYRESDAHSP